MSTLLGLDIGDRRVGVALAPAGQNIAVPMMTITRRGRKHLLEELRQIMQENNSTTLVVGIPKTLKGEIGPQAQKVLDEVEWLKERLETEWILWDERLSTLEVERMMRDDDVSSEKRKELRDQLAAQRILQSYLDSRKSGLS